MHVFHNEWDPILPIRQGNKIKIKLIMLTRPTNVYKYLLHTSLLMNLGDL